MKHLRRSDILILTLLALPFHLLLAAHLWSYLKLFRQ